MKSLFLRFVLVMLMGCGMKEPDPAPVYEALSFDLGISFPPVADAEQRNFTAPLLQELGVEIIRIGEDWRLREPESGQFNWGPLDARIDWAKSNNLRILLTIQSNGPAWACSSLQNDNSCVYQDNQDFRNYITTLLQRHPNRIDKIQFGNEWMSDFWYIGNGEAFTAAHNIVYDAIQAHSSDTRMVLGGFTTVSLRFLAGCNGFIEAFYDEDGELIDQAFFDANCDSPEFQVVLDKINYVLDQARYDEVDIHLYDDVENWAAYFAYIQSRVQKPIIITEFGGPNVKTEPTDEAYQSERLQAYIQTIDSMDVSEAYFFKLVEGTQNPYHTESGLINNPDLAKKQSYFRFRDMNQ
ncbi:MAG: glycosyl hydrolase [Bacteroidota bacterium]